MFFIIVALVGSIIASVTDFHKRWVPDYVNYGMVLIGITGYGVISILQKSYWPIVYSLIGAGVFYGVANLMFYAGMWGGGDAKLLMGFGALLPHLANRAPWPFLLTLFVNILIVGAFYGLIYTVFLSLKNWKIFYSESEKILKKNKIILIAFLALIGLVMPTILMDKLLFLSTLALWAMGNITVYLFLFSKVMEDHCMTKFMKPSEMDIGERIVDSVWIAGKPMYEPKKIGLEEEDLRILRRMEEKGQFDEGGIKVKFGVPYALAFVIGLIITLLYGDLIWILLNSGFMGAFV